MIARALIFVGSLAVAVAAFLALATAAIGLARSSALRMPPESMAIGLLLVATLLLALIALGVGWTSSGALVVGLLPGLLAVPLMVLGPLILSGGSGPGFDVSVLSLHVSLAPFAVGTVLLGAGAAALLARPVSLGLRVLGAVPGGLLVLAGVWMILGPAAAAFQLGFARLTPAPDAAALALIGGFLLVLGLLGTAWSSVGAAAAGGVLSVVGVVGLVDAALLIPTSVGFATSAASGLVLLIGVVIVAAAIGVGIRRSRRVTPATTAVVPASAPGDTAPGAV